MASLAGVEREAALGLPPEELVLDPQERRAAVLRVIRSARRRLALSLFRCDDMAVLDELAAAMARGVSVEALLTRRAKGWKKRLKGLGSFLKKVGAKVHRYSGPVLKYHAKYIVADDGPALIASLNFTSKCFDKTCDFALVTYDPEVVSGLQKLFEMDCLAPGSSLPAGISDRLIVGPDRARVQLGALLQQARHRLRIIDPRVKDPAMVALLKTLEARGVSVEVLGRGRMGGLLSHGKMILVDQETAVIGSISLSRPSLDSRREVAVKLQDPRCVHQLSGFFQALAAGRAAGKPGADGSFAQPKGSAS